MEVPQINSKRMSQIMHEEVHADRLELIVTRSRLRLAHFPKANLYECMHAILWILLFIDT
jgi:hypothetical protein